MTRLRAFTLHLTASVLLFLVFLGLIVIIWYPPPYFTIDGGWTLLKILISVHLVLGPLLTLIVFKPGKWGLRFDLICIGLLQLGALLYGGALLYQQRPTFVVFAVDRFTTIPAAAIDPDQVPPELRHGPQPRWVEAHFPKDPKARQAMMFAVVMEGAPDIEYRPELYQPYAPDLAQLRARSIDLPTMIARSADAQAAVDQFLAQHGGRLEDYFYLPLRGRNKDIVKVLSQKDGRPVGWISISPWLQDYPQKPQ
jgi:hypothetical protein